MYNLCYKPINYVGTRALKKPEATAAAATEAAASGGCCYGGVGYEMCAYALLTRRMNCLFINAEG